MNQLISLIMIALSFSSESRVLENSKRSIASADWNVEYSLDITSLDCSLGNSKGILTIDNNARAYDFNAPSSIWSFWKSDIGGSFYYFGIGPDSAADEGPPYAVSIVLPSDDSLEFRNCYPKDEVTEEYLHSIGPYYYNW